MRLIPTILQLKYAGEICRVDKPFEARDEDVASLMAYGCILAETECLQASIANEPDQASQRIEADNPPETPNIAPEQSGDELQGSHKKKPERARKTRKKAKEG